MNKTLLMLFLAVLCQSAIAGDIKFQVGGETGIYNSNQLNDQFIYRFIGRAAVKQQFGEHYFSLRSRLAPEFYGLQNGASTVKFSNNFILGSKKSVLPWQAHLGTKHYFYNLPGSNGLSFTIFLLGASIDRRINKKFSLRLLSDYFYRDTARQPNVNMDGLIVAPAGVFFVNRSTQLSAEFIIERFFIEQRRQADAQNKNDGWRLGPKLSINHRSAFLFNAFYRLIRHQSLTFNTDKLEHEFQLVWGRFLNKRLSVFFFLHYLKGQHGNAEIPASLAYTPANNENWYYLKLGLDASDRIELYGKIGYVRDDLIFSRETISGWQALFGLNLKL